MSREAKVMIKKMLTYNPDERINAEEAYNNEWINMFTKDSDKTVNLRFH